MTYIIPNPILKEKYASETRKFLLAENVVQSILEFNDVNVFESVARRTSVIVMVKEKCNEYEVDIFSNQKNTRKNIHSAGKQSQ